MDKIFQVATNISTPLALAGLFGAIFFYIARIILKKRISEANINQSSKPDYSKEDHNKLHLDQNHTYFNNSNDPYLAYVIIQRLFILCLIAIFLGFSGFIFQLIYANKQNHIPAKGDSGKILLQGIVYINNVETQGIQVKILEIEKTEQTNYFGKFKIEFYSTDKQLQYTMHFIGNGIDTSLRVKNDSLPKDYFFLNASKKNNPSAAISNSQIKSPILQSVIFKSHTLGQNKDHDTGIFITVLTADGNKIIGQIENADNTGNLGTEYSINTDHQLLIPIIAKSINKQQSKNFIVRLRQQTNGNDTWEFNGEILLNFSDGSTLSATKDNINLANNGASIIFSENKKNYITSNPIRISIQLSQKSNGYLALFIDGKKVNVLLESTSLNPIIEVKNPMGKNLLILTKAGDSCWTAVPNKLNSSLLRIVPNCL